MNRMMIEATTDDVGALRIQIPGRPGRYQVQVTIHWEEAAEAPGLGWPPGWLDAVFGSITDPTFVRHPQPPYEQRGELK